MGLPETVAEVCALPSEAHHRGTLPAQPRATRTRMGTLSGEGVAGVPLTICQGTRLPAAPSYSSLWGFTVPAWVMARGHLASDGSGEASHSCFPFLQADDPHGRGWDGGAGWKAPEREPYLPV